MKKVLLSLIACMTTIVMQAQFLTIGSGYASSSHVPVKPNYKYSFSEQIYTASEIGSAGTMKSLGFYNNGSDPQTRTLDVFVAFTDKNEFINMTEDDKVFSGEVTFAKDEWTTIAFDKPLEYDGTQNMIIAVNDLTGHYENDIDFRIFYSGQGYQSIYMARDESGPFDPSDLEQYYYHYEHYKNVIRLEFIQNISVMDEENNLVNELDFGKSDDEASRTLVLKNNSEAPVDIQVDLSCFPDNSFSTATQQITLAAGASESITVTMPSLPYGSRDGELTLSYLGTTKKIALKGTIVPPSVPLDEEHFPDEKFRQHVSFKYDTDKDGILGGDEILAVVTFAFYQGYNYTVNDLTGIEYFVEMQRFENRASQCTFTFDELDMSKFVKLTSFECELNNLKVLNLRNNKLLRELNCSRNQITDLDLSNNTELTSIICHDNQLSTIDLTACTKLGELSISNNQLKSLDLSNADKLESLAIDGNNIRGKAMDDLIASLPVFEGRYEGEYNEYWQEFVFLVYKPFRYSSDNTLNNVVTESQHQAALAKGWKTVYGSYDGYVEHFSPDGVVISDENFPDENLQKALFNKEEEAKDGVFTEEEIAGIEELNLYGCDISRLKGIEHFTAINHLYCYNNHLQGEAVDELIECLPIREEKDGEMDFMYFGNDDNVITKEQVDAAKEKGWKVFCYYGHSRQEFMGRPLPLVFYHLEDGEEDNMLMGEYNQSTIIDDLKQKGWIIEGDISYDDDTKTITLNGIKAANMYIEVNHELVDPNNVSNTPYTIKVNDANELVGMVVATSELSLVGNGTLSNSVLYAYVSLMTIDGPDIEVNSPESYGLYIGERESSTLDIKSGSLRLTATQHPLYMSGNDTPTLNLAEGMVVLAPADAVWTTNSYSGYFVDADGNPLGTTTLEIGVVDGISHAAIQPSFNQGCYTLDGRRIIEPTRKGIYIQNGHKVVR